MIPGKAFDPATLTSRRPTPEKFAHLRKWAEPIVRDIRITNITEMTNINQQLEQNAELYVSNIISRVIAQIIGKYGDGFVTIEGTADGKLKVEAAFAAGVTVGLDAGSELIGKVEIAGTSRTVLQADIAVAGAGHTEVVALVAGKKIKITNMAFTVDAEANVTFESATTAISGAMDFGGTDEPRGMVQHFGDFPMETVAGEAFQILTVGAGKVNGYVTYFTE